MVPDSEVPRARRTPGLVQEDHLASKLVVPDSEMPEATRSIPIPLCEIVKC